MFTYLQVDSLHACNLSVEPIRRVGESLVEQQVFYPHTYIKTLSPVAKSSFAYLL
jgi:hypothetical protein